MYLAEVFALTPAIMENVKKGKAELRPSPLGPQFSSLLFSLFIHIQPLSPSSYPMSLVSTALSIYFSARRIAFSDLLHR